MMQNTYTDMRANLLPKENLGLNGLMLKDMKCQCITYPCNCDGEPTKLDVIDSVQDKNVDFFESVKGGAGRVWDFTKETAENIVEEVGEQKERLDKKERLIKSVPNSFLVFGLVGLLLFSMVKK